MLIDNNKNNSSDLISEFLPKRNGDDFSKMQFYPRYGSLPVS